MEPISAIVAALVAGATAVANDTASAAIKDAYAGIKQLIKDRYTKVRLDTLEEEPNSKGQRQVVEEKLEQAGAQTDTELLQLAKTLAALLEAQAPEAAEAVGVNLSKITGETVGYLNAPGSHFTGGVAAGVYMGHPSPSESNPPTSPRSDKV